jgi:hypothetical protein
LGGSTFGDPDQQQRKPAEQDVAADAMGEPVEHRPQEQFALHVTEATFGLQEVLVAEGGVLGGQVGVGGREQVLPVATSEPADHPS